MLERIMMVSNSTQVLRSKWEQKELNLRSRNSGTVVNLLTATEICENILGTVSSFGFILGYREGLSMGFKMERASHREISHTVVMVKSH
jgi:hypothetical protein